LLNQSIAIKKPTNYPKTRNPINFFFPELRYVILDVFKGKKTPKRNPPHHMKSFDTKINCGSQNLLQRSLSLSKPEFSNSLSLPNKKGLKKRKIKLGTKMFVLKFKGLVT
jgi:hypothetical protein